MMLSVLFKNVLRIYSRVPLSLKGPSQKFDIASKATITSSLLNLYKQVSMHNFGVQKNRKKGA